MKIVIAFLIGFLIGAGCRWFDIPVPAPPRLIGALLILAITLGYLLTDRYLARGPSAPPPAVSRGGSGMEPRL